VTYPNVVFDVGAVSVIARLLSRWSPEHLTGSSSSRRLSYDDAIEHFRRKHHGRLDETRLIHASHAKRCGPSVQAHGEKLAAAGVPYLLEHAGEHVLTWSAISSATSAPRHARRHLLVSPSLRSETPGGRNRHRARGKRSSSTTC
jgi:hypothetical protein